VTKTKILVFNQEIYGLDLDNLTRCEHYHSPVDIVAIKFRCCQSYYACYWCHQAWVGHKIEQWPSCDFHTKAIFCGSCGTELTIHQYLFGQNQCPECKAAFNPRCRSHWSLYFQQVGYHHKCDCMAMKREHLH
jgi:uncharacterized CHY-type Zn-finger protein